MIFPDSPSMADKCWDVSPPQTLSHNGGDSQGISSMVKWTLSKYEGDDSRVFSMGTSSGAMMTNVLLGSYPDVLAVGSAWAGVAARMLRRNGYGIWSNACATANQIIRSQNLRKEIKDWTAVLELPNSPVQTLTDHPQSGWTTYVYGTSFTATSAFNITHDIRTIDHLVLSWFDLIYIGSGRFSRPNASGV
ncbi:hypothetical protein JHW43_005651 [Diplocarpon mali]|nr:hypothetical protein JHW43_005651 [Diplocarpon mali]